MLKSIKSFFFHFIKFYYIMIIIISSFIKEMSVEIYCTMSKEKILRGKFFFRRFIEFLDHAIGHLFFPLINFATSNKFTIDIDQFHPFIQYNMLLVIHRRIRFHTIETQMLRQRFYLIIG